MELLIGFVLFFPEHFRLLKAKDVGHFCGLCLCHGLPVLYQVFTLQFIQQIFPLLSQMLYLELELQWLVFLDRFNN